MPYVVRTTTGYLGRRRNRYGEGASRQRPLEGARVFDKRAYAEAACEAADQVVEVKLVEVTSQWHTLDLPPVAQQSQPTSAYEYALQQQKGGR